MGVAIYPVFDKNLRGVDTFINGKGLAAAEKELHCIAESLGVKPLLDFYSVSRVEVKGFLEDEGIEVDEERLPNCTWFEPREGLRTVSSLIKYIEAAVRQSDVTPQAIEDLKYLQRLLVEAEEQGCRFYLAVDF